jgi:hypothetical protein
MHSSPPRVLFVGKPSMGSWWIRARQIASARPHWAAAQHLTAAEIAAADVIVFVKTTRPRAMRLLRALGKVVVWDVLDCWRQPDDGLRLTSISRIRDWFAGLRRHLDLDGAIFPNRAMRDDLGDLVPNPVTIYHHSRPGLATAVVREPARIVGYEGDPAYLGEWRAVVERACRRLGLRFAVNPAEFTSIDIGFAARGAPHGCLISRRYKSNVKLANFYGAGLPCLLPGDELSYRETDAGDVRFFADPAGVEAGLAALLPADERRRIHARFLQTRGRFALAAIAEEYERYFGSLVAGSAPPLAAAWS